MLCSWPHVPCIPRKIHFPFSTSLLGLPGGLQPTGWTSPPHLPLETYFQGAISATPSTSHYVQLTPGSPEKSAVLICQLSTTKDECNRQIEKYIIGCHMPLYFILSSVSGVWGPWERSLVSWTKSRVGEFSFCHLLAVSLQASYFISLLLIFFLCMWT